MHCTQNGNGNVGIADVHSKQNVFYFCAWTVCGLNYTEWVFIDKSGDMCVSDVS